jgi:hypothetical protein
MINLLDKSIIVAAHPDDEMLWFSSILDKVDEVVLCFLTSTSNPHANEGRIKALQEYSLNNVSCLGLQDSGAFYDVDWKKTAVTQFGIEINEQFDSFRRYKENYFRLIDHLESKLAGFKNVFTHNPWGEYGHHEHVQVYRVIKELQEKLKFNLWVTNYCSDKSFRLMLTYVSSAGSDRVTFKTNKALAKDLKQLYVKHDCWTYYDDWEWFDEESFIRDADFRNGTVHHGHMFLLNLIKVEPPFEPKINYPLYSRIISRLCRPFCEKYRS